MEWYWVIITIIAFFFILYVIVKLGFWLFEVVYHYQHPEKKRLNKRLLKSYLVGRYGKHGKTIYSQMKKSIWEKYKIR